MKGKLTIGRQTYGDGRKSISIQVEDAKSRVRFLDIEISCEDFAQVLTGLSCVECEIEVRNLGAVGKTKSTIKVEAVMPSCNYDQRTKVAYEACKLATPEGWKTTSYFGSKDSFFYDGKVEMAKTTAVRWD